MKYAASIYARKQEQGGTITEHAVIIIKNAPSKDDAERQAHEYALKKWPAADGWSHHSEAVTKA